MWKQGVGVGWGQTELAGEGAEATRFDLAYWATLGSLTRHRPEARLTQTYWAPEPTSLLLSPPLLMQALHKQLEKVVADLAK